MDMSMGGADVARKRRAASSTDGEPIVGELLASPGLPIEERERPRKTLPATAVGDDDVGADGHRCWSGGRDVARCCACSGCIERCKIDANVERSSRRGEGDTRKFSHTAVRQRVGATAALNWPAAH